MSYNTVLIIIATIIVIIVFLVENLKKTTEESTASSMITSGFLMMTSGVCTINDTVLNICIYILNTVLPSFDMQPANKINSLCLMIFGFLLICCGFYFKKTFNEYLYILNMYGMTIQKDIDEVNAISNLKLTKYKIKEQIIDFSQLFNSGVNSNVNKYICKYIEKNANKFSNKIAEQKKSFFSGMAPVPYTIYTGTFLNNAKISNYFEYSVDNGGHYYCLKKAKKRELNNWENLSLILPQNPNTNATEIVLSISISKKIQASELSQFSTDIVQLNLNTPKDNVIMYLQQLQSYSDKIYKSIQDDIMNTYPNLKTLHITAAIPSCMSIEMGKCISSRTNRIADIVIHHYDRSATPHYPFGVYVNGQNKGKLWKK